MCYLMQLRAEFAVADEKCIVCRGLPEAGGLEFSIEAGQLRINWRAKLAEVEPNE